MKIHFIGIGGIGVSALARYYLKKGHKVSGSDLVETEITKINTPGPLVDDPKSTTGELKELSNTDIAEELVNQVAIEYGFKANAKVIQNYEETLGTVIDMMG